MTLGITTPVWVALWLWTSPIASLQAAPPSPTLSAALAIDEADLSVLPHSLIWGYILPTVMAGLPAPAIISYDQKVTFLLIWQIFPVLTSVTHFLLSTAARRLRPRGEAPATATADDETREDPAAAFQCHISLAHRLRWVYTFVLMVTAAVHSLTFLFVLVPSLRPQSLAPVDPASIGTASVFMPELTLLSKVVGPVSSIAQGVLPLLQYDAYFGAAAMLYWASRQFRASTDGAPGLSSVMSLLAGPAGAALILVWRRDEQLLLNNAPKVKAN